MTTNDLPFYRAATETEAGCAWEVTPSHDYEKDCIAGREMGSALIELMQSDRGESGAVLLSYIVREMVRRGPALFGGIEIGFLTILSGEIVRSGGVCCHDIGAEFADTLPTIP